MKIAVVAPAGCVKPDEVNASVCQLEQLGVTCVVGQHVFAQHRYMAGRVDQRIADLQTACQDDDIDAIWCARGGTGAAQLLPHLDDWLLQKPLIGYSDISVLLNWIAQRGGQAIHGPVVQELASKNRLPEAAMSLDGQETLALLQLPHLPVHYPVQAVLADDHPVSGRIVGGNLATLASLQGTPWAVQLHQSSLLLIEDVGESLYRLERMLVQLLQSIDVQQLRAVVLGDFDRCPQHQVPHTLAEIVAEHVQPLGIALYQADWFGHGAHNRPFRIGASAVIEQQQLVIGPMG